jgi:NAD(P)-dependent dehydrogenase (short-subunit alcohol dehydrogenase family)
MKKVIVITGASSGFGLLSANALAKAGHTVYASMRDTAGRNAPQAADGKKFAHDNQVDLRPIEMDVSSEKSIEAAIRQIVAERGRLDVLIHNAGHMVFGPAEAFTPEQLAELYDINVLSTQRVNRVALPQMRKSAKGSSSGCLAAARRAERLPISPPTLPRRQAWTQWRYRMRAHWRCGASKRRSSFPAHSPVAPITSRIPARPPTSSGSLQRRPLPPLFRRMRMRAR